MKILVFWSLIFVLTISRQLYAQPDPPTAIHQMTIESEIKQLRETIILLKKADERQKKAISDINNKLSKTQKNLADNDIAAQNRINDLNENSINAQNSISGLDKRLRERSVQLGFAVFFTGILGLLALFMIFIVRKRYTMGSALLESRLAQIRERLDNENIRLESTLVELMQKQMKISVSNTSIDHSLPLKVGEEIFRMRQRLNALPDDTKGLKPLQKSLERLEGEFNQQGYELINLHGLNYDEGMSVKAKFVASDELEIGQAIITKVIKPQINYKNVSIQDSEIEVSTGG